MEPCGAAEERLNLKKAFNGQKRSARKW